MKTSIARKVAVGGMCAALTLALSAPVPVLSALGAGSTDQAYADASSAYWTAPTTAVTIDENLLTTYGVRAGSAGGDFVGITNTNYDFRASGASAQDQYTNLYEVTATDLATVTGAGLAIWATSVNENVNPYYANLYYKLATDAADVTAATTWSGNYNSWGDSFGVSTSRADGTSTINGLEYSPDIIFGANKSTNWSNFDASTTTIAEYLATDDSDYSPTFTNNDSTNMWTQIYTIGQLAATADSLKEGTEKSTRYDDNSSATGALSYEKSLRGNLLYIASQIDYGNAEKKTVAYLYCIDSNGTAYFFTPTADNLTYGDDTGETYNSAAETADDNYAANNSTINMDYLGVLPYITDTFTGGTEVEGGIVMKVEDIYKSNPAVSVASGTAEALADVDVIIYNTTTQDNLIGTSGGKNESGITGNLLSTDSVSTWANACGFNGTIIAGDDFGTSSNQGFGTVSTTEEGMSPMLYCQRNYTTDKPARAAWAFSKVYPELYPNSDASYAYWVDKVYHINTASVGTVVRYMTNQSDEVVYNEEIAEQLEECYQTGLDWWVQTGSTDAEWSQYAYYNGSSRASYYDSNELSEEPTNVIGIFQPSTQWAAYATSTEQVYRLYNAATSEHLYTTDENEYNTLPAYGWTQEGVSWSAPETGDTAVYRLYNSISGDHHYTTDTNEVAVLSAGDWTDEGVFFYSASDTSKPVYRLYNSSLTTGQHHFTADANEYATLPDYGWTQESVAWYGL